VTPDAAEAVDRNLDRHVALPVLHSQPWAITRRTSAATAAGVIPKWA
jgi:hypothetical protein